MGNSLPLGAARAAKSLESHLIRYDILIVQVETFPKSEKQLVPRSPSLANHKEMSMYRLPRVPSSGRLSVPAVGRTVSCLLVFAHLPPPTPPWIALHAISPTCGESAPAFQGPTHAFSPPAWDLPPTVRHTPHLQCPAVACAGTAQSTCHPGFHISVPT